MRLQGRPTSPSTCPTPTSRSRSRAPSARARRRRSGSGGILRPKADGEPAHFYTLVTRDTREQDFAANRQLFLTEQGYSYTIEDAEQLFPPDVIQRATKPSMNGRANGRGNGSNGRASASSPRVKRPRSPNGSPNGAPHAE